MRKLLTIALLVAALMTGAPASAAPYVSCPGGYIAQTLDQCPIIVRHPVGGPRPGGGGGGGGRGLLGDFLDSIGLGSLGGLL